MSVTGENFEFIQAFARDAAALVIEPGKEYLVESRLTPIARQAGFNTLNAFVQQLRTGPPSTRFHDQVLEALTTNETSFFRDFQPFEALRLHILPKIIEQRAPTRKLAIWSAACSSGQEAYSIAILVREFFPQLKEWSITILGTDLSPNVLSQARQGIYSQLEVNRGLPTDLLRKYFSATDAKWVVNDDLKRLVEFKTMNLVKPWPILPVFDVIFIRNVMIYFDMETKKSVLRRARQCLGPNGSLFLGTAETTINLDPDWESLTLGKATIYVPRPALDAAA